MKMQHPCFPRRWEQLIKKFGDTTCFVSYWVESSPGWWSGYRLESAPKVAPSGGNSFFFNGNFTGLEEKREKVAGTRSRHEEMEQRLPFSTINPITLCGLKYWAKLSVKCMKARRGHSSEEPSFSSTCPIFRKCVRMYLRLNLRSFLRVRRLFPQSS